MTRGTFKNSTRLLLTVLRLGIAVALLAWLSRSGVIDWRALRGMAVAWPLALVTTILVLIDQAITAWRLCVLVRPLRLELGLWASTRLTLISSFFSLCLPGATGGDAIRIWYATKGNKGRRMEVATIMLMDRVVGMFSLLLWPLVAALFFPRLIASSSVFSGLLQAAGLFALCIAIVFVAAASSRLRYSRVAEWVLRMLPLGHHLTRIVDTVHAYGRHKRALAQAVGISLLAQAVAIGITLLIAQMVTTSGAVWRMCVLIPFGFLANAVPLTPGGLGVGEAAFDKLFQLAGLSGGANVLLGWRLLTIVVGLVGLAFYLSGPQQFVRSVLDSEDADEFTVESREASQEADLASIRCVPWLAANGGTGTQP